jgi:hypothetical protein
MATIVTGLFDINRNTMDGREWKNYLNWFEKTLSLNCPMVIFIEENNINFVKNARKNFPTKIISQNIHDLPYYQYKEKMDKIILSEDYKNKIKDNKRIECNFSLYSIIQYSKFEWMKVTSELNPFESDYFIWMDAGLSRFFDDLDTKKEYPSKHFKQKIKNLNNKVLIQIFMSYYPDLFEAKMLTDDYLLDNRSYVMGGMFASNQIGIRNINLKMKELFEEMLQNNIVNNEQIALGFLFKKYPDMFVSYINNSRIHRNYELINCLSGE